MIWNELKEFCNSLSEVQLNKKVILWREEDAINKIEAEVLQEDHYFDPEEPTEGCFTLSEAGISIEDSGYLSVAYEKGDAILWENF